MVQLVICTAANEEYYQMLMINDSQPPGFDVSSYTIEEINSITSEYTLKNTVSTAPLTVDAFSPSCCENCKMLQPGVCYYANFLHYMDNKLRRNV